MGEALQGPLAGKRVVITRAAAQSEALARELTARGASPIVVPLVAFAEPESFSMLDVAIERIAAFEWMVFTSAQAIRAVAGRAEQLKYNFAAQAKGVRVATVGPVTAEAAQQAGLIVDFVAETHTGASLGAELRGKVGGGKVFLPRSDQANPDLPRILRSQGVEVLEVIAYRTLRPSEGQEAQLKSIAERGADAILFFSPSAVQHFGEVLGAGSLRRLASHVAIAAVGPVTAKALREAGVENFLTATETTAASVVQLLETYFTGKLSQMQAGAKRA